MIESSKKDQLPAPKMPAFRVYLCGPFRLERRAGEQWVAVVSEWNKRQSSRTVLKALLGCPGRQARKDALLTLLWPDDDPQKSGPIVNKALTSFRQIFAEHFLEDGVRSNLYQLQGQESIWVDVDAANDLLARAEQLGRTSQEALPLLEEAVAYLTRGSYLEDEEGLWLYERRKGVSEALYNARLWLAEASTQRGLVGQAERQWRALLATDPVDEDVLETALTHLHQQGMTAKALRLYTQIEERLAEEEETLSQRIHALVDRFRQESIAESGHEKILGDPLLQRNLSPLSSVQSALFSSTREEQEVHDLTSKEPAVAHWQPTLLDPLLASASHRLVFSFARGGAG